ncbi:cupin domain-containing protein [Sphingosinicella microcystinivorans]|uniref:Cupin domain n=1 Tax=Sphingosinicella microcystinivorans TaxID=335406 RepID=A0AAD1D693_SPHMI|nr:cupin domain-containing protein [Sphingosinicella microcystinivorans]RKS91377.1 cupin domain [Sphingosinicella microcystinivorans]BBE34350.1 hypothetical protein SmB9_20080 [Sphingosinicella microcystinivorans]
MKVVPSILASEAVRDLVDHGGVRCRTIVSSFAAGLRVPEDGFSVHDVTEISLILSGSFDLESGGELTRLNEGDLVMVPPGEPHFFHVRADTRIFTLTIGDA